MKVGKLAPSSCEDSVRTRSRQLSLRCRGPNIGQSIQCAFTCGPAGNEAACQWLPGMGGVVEAAAGLRQLGKSEHPRRAGKAVRARCQLLGRSPELDAGRENITRFGFEH